MPVYRYTTQGPGCSGCLFIVALVALATGGLPALANLVGIVLTLFVGLVLAAILGFFLFTSWVRRQVAAYERSQTEIQHRFVTSLINILVHVAGHDGEVSRAEVRVITDFFRTSLGYDQQQIYWVREVIKQAMAARPPLETLLADFRDHFGYEPRLILVELVLRIVHTKPGPPPEELELARRIANFLGISYLDQQALFGRWRAGAAGAGGAPAGAGPAADRYYRVLGLEPGASWEEIKKAYRSLSMQYHPDKVAHLGDEFKKVAEEKMKEINEAYQALKEQHGR